VVVVDSDVECGIAAKPQKAAKTQFLVPWHPTAAATNNSMTDLYAVSS
jgi:hypothetical protein